MSDTDTPTGQPGGPTVTDDPAPPPPPPGGAGDEVPRAPHRLMRSADDAKVAGVAGGIGRYLGIDPTLVRVAFVLLAFAGGSGIVLYGACWLVMPADDGSQVWPDRPVLALGGVPTAAKAALLVAGVLLVGDRLVDGGPTFFWGVLLIAAGVLLFQDDQRRPAAAGGAPGPLPTPPGEPAQGAASGGAAAAAPTSSWAGAGGAGWDAQAGHPATPAAEPRPAGPPVVRLTLAAAAVVSGAAALLDRTVGLVDMTGTRWLSLMLVVVGLGLVAGAFLGAGRGLLWLGAGLVPLLVVGSLASTVAGGTVAGGAGQRLLRPSSEAEVARPFTLGMGELVIDLRDLPPTDAVVQGRVGLGELVVVVPAGADVQVDARVGLGEVDIRGAQPGTGPSTGPAAREAFAPTDPDYVVELAVGLGTIRVEREERR